MKSWFFGVCSHCCPLREFKVVVRVGLSGRPFSWQSLISFMYYKRRGTDLKSSVQPNISSALSQTSKVTLSSPSPTPLERKSTLHLPIPPLTFFTYFADTRESAFIHAITAAGVTYSVTQGCSSGQVHDCPCDRSLSGNGHFMISAFLKHFVANFTFSSRNFYWTSVVAKRWCWCWWYWDGKGLILTLCDLVTGTKSVEGSWEWGGCGDNVHVGYKRSKDILDLKIKRRTDIRSLMLLHNNEAGRLVSFPTFLFHLVSVPIQLNHFSSCAHEPSLIRRNRTLLSSTSTFLYHLFYSVCVFELRHT
jgi:hypothetical protein